MQPSREVRPIPTNYCHWMHCNSLQEAILLFQDVGEHDKTSKFHGHGPMSVLHLL